MSRQVVLRLAQVCLALQVLLVGTGSAVRVTGSGLGCPDWPRCTSDSLAATAEQGGHGAIEFGNRLLAVVLQLAGLALVVAVLRCRERQPGWLPLAWVQAAIVPVQAVIGGLLVLSDLNPYVLQLHFLTSFPLVLAAAALVQRVADPGPREPLALPLVRRLLGGLVLSATAVLVAGTLVTGTGPHAGGEDVDRLPFDPRDVTQLHADLVWLLVGLTVASAVAVRLTDVPVAVRQGVVVLAALEVGQAALGYAQYYYGVPAAAVVVHVLLAAVVFTVAAWTWLRTAGPRPARTAAPIPAPSRGTATAR